MRLIEQDAVGGDQLGFPTVIRTQGRLGSPIDNWYLWVAPHDNPGGVYLFTAPDPDGPWSLYDADPVLPTPDGMGHVSSPYVLWDDDNSRFLMWAHLQDPAVGQHTFLWTSTDGIAWTQQNSGDPVLPLGDEGDADESEATYLNVVRFDGQFYGYYQGFGQPYQSICEAVSDDGVTWTKNGQAWAPVGHSDLGPVPVVVDGAICVYYNQRFGGGGDLVRDPVVRRRNADGTWSTPTSSNIGIGSAGEWDSANRTLREFVWTSGRWWAFYRGNDVPETNVGDEIGLMWADLSTAGIDTTWGKG